MVADSTYLPVPKFAVRSDFDSIVIRLITIKCRPVLIGEVSLETGYPLLTCEWHLERMVDLGSISRVDSDEWRSSRGFSKIVIGYFLP